MPTDPETVAGLAEVVIAIAVGVIITGIGVTIAILWSIRHGLPAMLVTSLTLVVLVLVGIYALFGEERQEIVPLASAALGALVATLTQQYVEHRYAQRDKDAGA